MGNNEQQQNIADIESDDEKIERLLGELKRVNAPADFDFCVKARIATGRSPERPAFGLPAAVRYAIPLILLMLVGAYFGFNAFYADNHVDVPVVAETAPANVEPQMPPASNEKIVTPANESPDDRAVLNKPDNASNAVIQTPVKKIQNTDPQANKPGGGSYDATSSEGPRFFPRGLNPNTKVPVNQKGFGNSAQITAKDVLTLIGIKAVFAESGWKVESAAANSLATRAGVKTGDVIEAINDKTLTEKTVFGSTFTGKSLSVRRDGKTIQLELKN